MHPFGGPQVCPKCEKAVYAAEQVMGPGRKLYHKPCLSCTICSKRLDSYTLLEHDQKPYCKSCHLKNFGTRDLRQANLPHRDPSPPPEAPPRVASPVRAHNSGPLKTNLNPLPRLRPNRSLVTSPLSPTLTDRAQRIDPDPTEDSTGSGEQEQGSGGTNSEEERDIVAGHLQEPPSSPPRAGPSPFPSSRPPPLHPGTPASTRPRLGLGLASTPRAVPLSPTRRSAAPPAFAPSSGRQQRHQPSKSVPSFFTGGGGGSADGAAAAEQDGDDGDVIMGTLETEIMKPLSQTATGTRYGAALGGKVPLQLTGGGPGASPRNRWGTANPSCPRCGKSVYFAEQVKAVGKTYHKGCLRCTECNTLLDSTRLRDHDGEPICMRCYGKVHGPQGSGYALLGKAGG